MIAIVQVENCHSTNYQFLKLMVKQSRNQQIFWSMLPGKQVGMDVLILSVTNMCFNTDSVRMEWKRCWQWSEGPWHLKFLQILTNALNERKKSLSKSGVAEAI